MRVPESEVKWPSVSSNMKFLSIYFTNTHRGQAKTLVRGESWVAEARTETSFFERRLPTMLRFPLQVTLISTPDRKPGLGRDAMRVREPDGKGAEETATTFCTLLREFDSPRIVTSNLQLLYTRGCCFSRLRASQAAVGAREHDTPDGTWLQRRCTRVCTMEASERMPMVR